MSHHETITQTLTGNGLVFEHTEKTGGKVPWWWIKDVRVCDLNHKIAARKLYASKSIWQRYASILA